MTIGYIGSVGSGGGGGVPIGSLVEFNKGLPDLYVKGSETYLKTGVSAPSNLFPNFPEELTSELIPVVTKEPLFPIGDMGDSAAQKGHHLIQNGTKMVAFATNTWSTGCLVSIDTGVTWNLKSMPIGGMLLSAQFVGSMMVAVYADGRVYSSTSGDEWTNCGVFRYGDPIGSIKKANNILFLLPAVSTAGSPVTATSKFLWYTEDGITFNKTTTLTHDYCWNDIVYTGSKYVMSNCSYGVNLTFCVSTNGKTGWSPVVTTLEVYPCANDQQWSSRIGPTNCLHMEGSTIYSYQAVMYYYTSQNYHHAALVKSTDNGASWTKVSAPYSTDTSFLNCKDPQVVTFNSAVYHLGKGFIVKRIGASESNASFNNGQLGSEAGSTAPTFSANRHSSILYHGSKFWYCTKFGPADKLTPLSTIVSSVANTEPRQKASTVLVHRENPGENRHVMVRGGALNNVILLFSGLNPLRKIDSAYGYGYGAFGTASRYSYSNDNGQTWTTRSLPLSCWVNTAAWDGSYFYFTTTAGNISNSSFTDISNRDEGIPSGATLVYRSADGKTWSQVSSTTLFRYDTPLPTPSLLVAGSGYLSLNAGSTSYFSADKGVTWEVATLSTNGRSTIPPNSVNFEANTTKYGTVIAGLSQHASALITVGNLMFSSDGGRWINITPPAFAISATEPLLTSGVALNDGSVIFCGIENKGLFITSNLMMAIETNQTDTALLSRFPGSSNNRVILRMDPVTEKIYALCLNNLYVSSNNGASWNSSYTLNIKIPAYGPMIFDVYNGQVWVGDGNNVYKVPKGSYVNNFTQVSTEATVKYMRVT